MSREDALDEAAADPLGRQYATARRGSRLYLTWRDPNGAEGVQIVHRHYGVRQFRQVLPPRGLSWRPVLEAWKEVSLSAGEPARSGG